MSEANMAMGRHHLQRLGLTLEDAHRIAREHCQQQVNVPITQLVAETPSRNYGQMTADILSVALAQDTFTTADLPDHYSRNTLNSRLHSLCVAGKLTCVQRGLANVRLAVWSLAERRLS